MSHTTTFGRHAPTSRFTPTCAATSWQPFCDAGMLLLIMDAADGLLSGIWTATIRLCGLTHVVPYGVGPANAPLKATDTYTISRLFARSGTSVCVCAPQPVTPIGVSVPSHARLKSLFGSAWGRSTARTRMFPQTATSP